MSISWTCPIEDAAASSDESENSASALHLAKCRGMSIPSIRSSSLPYWVPSSGLVTSIMTIMIVALVG